MEIRWRRQGRRTNGLRASRRPRRLDAVRLPVGREKLWDLVAGHRGQSLQNVGQVFLGIDAIPTATLDKGVDNRGPPTRVGVPDQEPVTLSDRRRPYVIFHDVAINLKP